MRKQTRRRAAVLTAGLALALSVQAGASASTPSPRPPAHPPTAPATPSAGVWSKELGKNVRGTAAAQSRGRPAGVAAPACAGGLISVT